MDNKTWLLGPLLWEVARYWQIFCDTSDNKAGIYSQLYSKNPSLDAFAAAIERYESNNALALMQEALSLARGLPYETSVAGLAKTSKPSTIPTMVSVFSRVRLEQNDQISTFYHTLPDVSKDDALKIQLTDSASIDTAKLKQHLNYFMTEMQFLKSINSHQKLETVLTLIEKYFWCLPSYGSAESIDIPLFAISKLATAIVSCWEKNVNSLPEIPDRNKPIYTIIQGDLSGIQKYLYRISSAKGAAKGLKGRSFELILLTNTVVRYILHEVELSSANIIFNSGGKFILLAQERAYEQIERLQTMLEEKCYTYFDGEIFMGLGGVRITGNDFNADKFADKWDEATIACNATKQQKFASLITNKFEKVFEPKGSGKEKETCDVCGWEDTDGNKLILQFEATPEERKICPRCDEMERLGRLLTRAKYLAEVVNEQKPIDRHDLVRIEPLELGVVYYIISKDPPPVCTGESIIYYSFDIPTFTKDYPLVSLLQRQEVNCSFLYYGGNDLPREKRGEPAEYNDLANKSEGLKRLGVLRMDVDNLGRVFRSGLAEYNDKKLLRRIASPARVMALSWHINHFFTYQINYLREEEKFKDHIFILYSGGDDLFIVGSWDRVVDFAITIQKAFCEFTHNPKLTISGGIAIIPRKFPIHKAADFSGQAEDAAKEIDSGAKDAFTLLEKPLRWDEFEIVDSIRHELKNALNPTDIGYNENKQPLNKGILDRLRRLYALYDQSRRNKATWPRETPAQIKHYLEALRYDKWRWMLTYSLSRYSKNNPQYESLIKRLQAALIDNKWVDKEGREYISNRDIIDFIDVSSRWVEFLTREEPE